MDKAYMNTYFLKDMLSISTSFSRHGMFLTGIEETKTFTELTRLLLKEILPKHIVLLNTLNDI